MSEFEDVAIEFIQNKMHKIEVILKVGQFQVQLKSWKEGEKIFTEINVKKFSNLMKFTNT